LNLDKEYASFGYVLAGMDVVDAIAECEVVGSAQSPRPVEDVFIESITFVQPK
jgi:cyclophilin family peptidyl-prolyl cis-trans isomerase